MLSGCARGIGAMIPLPQDFSEFLQSLNDQRVRYLLIDRPGRLETEQVGQRQAERHRRSPESAIALDAEALVQHNGASAVHLTLHIQLLGDFHLVYGDKPVTDVTTGRLQSLLAYLLLHHGATQPRQHLAFLFWPDSTEAQARNNLRQALHQLRHALPDAEHFLYADTTTLCWRSDASFSLDVADFAYALAMVDEAERIANPAGLRAALEQAVNLYRGDLLPSCYDEWIAPERERLREQSLQVLERLIRLLEEQREYTAAIHYAQRLLRYDPRHEDTYLCLIRLHSLNSDRAGAS